MLPELNPNVGWPTKRVCGRPLNATTVASPALPVEVDCRTTTGWVIFGDGGTRGKGGLGTSISGTMADGAAVRVEPANEYVDPATPFRSTNAMTGPSGSRELRPTKPGTTPPPVLTSGLSPSRTPDRVPAGSPRPAWWHSP